MNHTLKNQECKISDGTVITGKWHQHQYQIVQPLGYGATGYVYLAKSNRGLVALKMSNNSMAITSEVNVLRRFSKVQGSTLGPSLLDVDDWVRPDTKSIVPFYVMEYMKGTNLLTFLQQRGHEWFSVLILQLLSDLERLHQEGWVFGDLKPENLLVVGPPPKIRWLDVGGTTLLGRSIKEYTEFYDRGYWGLGSRKAEPSYDLFAVGMVMIQTQYPKRFTKSGTDTLKQLAHAINEKPVIKHYEPVIIRALQGKYQNAEEMRQEFLHLLGSERKSRGNSKGRSLSRQPQKQVINKQPKGNHSKMKGVLETVLIAALLLLGYVLYIYGQLI